MEKHEFCLLYTLSAAVKVWLLPLLLLNNERCRILLSIADVEFKRKAKRYFEKLPSISKLYLVNEKLTKAINYKE